MVKSCLRVFVSYARQDRDRARQLVDAIRRRGHAVLWDKELPPGVSFVDRIKEDVAAAHVFMPLLTPASVEHAWINQEIG